MLIKAESNSINNRVNSFGSGSTVPRVITGKRTLSAIDRMGAFSSPHQRLLLGVTALMTQPFIDLYNKSVDEKTRIVSCARTLAKNLIGVITGILVRDFCIRAIDFCTETDAEKINKIKSPFWRNIRQKLSTSLIPTTVGHKEFAGATRKLLKHKQALGTFFALAVMMVTNFAVDVPLTKITTNYFNNKFQKAVDKKNAVKGGS